jgi:hypothetical protein
MFKKSFFAVAAALVAFTALALVGCGSDDEQKSSGFVGEVMDSVAATVADHMDSNRLKPADGPVETVDLAYRETDPQEGSLPTINDLLIAPPFVYAAFDGGLMIYDLESQTYTVTPVQDNLHSIAMHSGQVFVGGTELYQVEGAVLQPIDGGFVGEISDLLSFNSSLMIGTDRGLFSRDALGAKALFDGVAISALTAENEEAVWVGTSGRGLYRWDGTDFKRRYLQRDTSLFDNVTALAFNHNHLYLGTPEAMYVYNGGSWATVSNEDGLPQGEITSIDASDWTVYVGTSAGLVSYFDGVITPVERLDQSAIASLAVSGRRIIAGTESDGVILKKGPSYRKLVEPWTENSKDLASVSTLH